MNEYVVENRGRPIEKLMGTQQGVTKLIEEDRGHTTIVANNFASKGVKMTVGYPFQVMHDAAVACFEQHVSLTEAFFFMSKEEREFLISGIDPETWDGIFDDQ